MCVADYGKAEARECGKLQRDEIRPFELAHSCRRYLIMARGSNFRDFLFVQSVAMAGSVNPSGNPGQNKFLRYYGTQKD
jgi:hypothetical protein